MRNMAFNLLSPSVMPAKMTWRSRMTAAWGRLLRQSDGQDLIEYALLLAFIGTLVLVSLTGLGTKVPFLYSSTAAEMPDGNPGDGNPGNDKPVGSPGPSNPGHGPGPGNPGNGNPGNDKPVGNPGGGGK